MDLALLQNIILDSNKDYEYYSKYSLGYPLSQNNTLLQINNAGDPYEKSYWQMTSHNDEKYVVEWFAKLFNIDNPWGYCTTGSSESILCSLWCARKRFPNAKIYASSDSHFCIRKSADILAIEYVEIESINGCMNIDLLVSQLQNENIIVFTMGTTIKGSYDNISDFYNNPKYKKTKNHIHIDAAFGGMIYPFMKPEWLNYHFDTINISLHKFIGVPIPCSLFLIRNDLKQEIARGKCAGAYGNEMICIPEKDFCISCSRSGLSVILVKKYLENFDKNIHIKNIKELLELKDYFIKKIKVLNPESTDLSLSVVFDLPQKNNISDIVSKYSLSKHYNKTHIYFCNHVKKELIDEFIHDII